MDRLGIVRPHALGLPFVYDVLDNLVVEFGVNEFVADDLFDFRVIEGDDVLLQSVFVHIRR